MKEKFASLLVLITLHTCSGQMLIENGDFENGLQAWETNACQASVEEGAAHVTDRIEKHSGIFQMLNTTLLSQMDTALRLSFSVKTTSEVSMTWQMEINQKYNSKKYTMATWTSKGEIWQNLWFTFSLSEFIQDAVSAKIYPDLENGVDYWLDDIVLKPADDQTWKEEANKRIDKLRKRDVQIVLEGDGTEDVLIELVQKTHSFPFGTMIFADNLNDCYMNNVDSDYCKFTKDNFNWVVDNSKMKWKYMEYQQGVWRTDPQDGMMQWVQRNGLNLRGHCLLWSRADRNPAWTLGLDTKEFIDAVYERLDFTTKWAEPYAMHWDVINEMVDEPGNHTYYLDKTGDPEFRVKIFKRVKELIPNTTLFLNDYGILTNNNNRLVLYQEQIRELLASGAPIDAIGIQSHLSEERIDAEYFTYVIEELYKEFGLPIWITEFDWNRKGAVTDPDYMIQAEQLEDFYTLMFSLEAIEGIMMWGFIKDHGSLVDQNIKPNAAGEAYLRLYHDDWRTNSSTNLNNVENTQTMIRGFRGNYELKISSGGTRTNEVFTFSLDEDMEIMCKQSENGWKCNQ